MQSLIDVQNTAFMAIGPSRIAAISLLALTQDQGDSDSRDPQKVTELSVQRITAAYDMLDGGLEALLDPCGYHLPEELEDKRLSCLKMLKPLHRAVTQTDGDMLEEVQRIPNLASLCLDQLEPSISAFLKDMVQTLRDAQKEREAQREEDMRNTIAHAEGVGRNIKLISFNASIEAARIGEMGRGFAVIATEIRDLSGKTQTLLDEISGYLKH